MSLHIISGAGKEQDNQIVRLALENYPSILIDASRSANIHNFPEFSPEQFANVHVIEVEALYRLTTTLRKLKTIADGLKIKNIFITTFRLFNYGNDDEIKNISIYSWEIIGKLCGEFNIIAGVEKGEIHEKLAKMQGAEEIIMGHTLTSQRIIVDNIMCDLENFSKSLSEEDRQIYAEMIKEPLKHLGSITYTSSMNTWAIFLLCIMLEREKNERNQRMSDRQL